MALPSLIRRGGGEVTAAGGRTQGRIIGSGVLSSISRRSRNLWGRVPAVGGRLSSSLNSTIGVSVPLIGGMALGNVLLVSYLVYRWWM